MSDVHLPEPVKSAVADECVEEMESDDCASKKSDSSTSCSGSWSLDDSIEFIQTSHMPDELPVFSIDAMSPTGRTLSPILNEPISLFNLSISPISSVEDLTRINEQSAIYSGNANIASGNYTKEWTQNDYSIVNDYPDPNELISLDEIHAQINTPPSALSKSNKRLNLETIFEDVFLETPKKKRFNEFRLNSWRIETFQVITNEERISSYVSDQLHSKGDDSLCTDTSKILCDEFDEKINL